MHVELHDGPFLVPARVSSLLGFGHYKENLEGVRVQGKLGYVQDGFRV